MSRRGHPEPVRVLDAEGRELLLPAVWEVCHRCDGAGEHDHPAFSDGFTGSEWRELCHDDPDWPEDYARGVYSVACEVCKGRTTVAVVNREACTPEQLQALDEHDEAERYADAERAAERWMGA